MEKRHAIIDKARIFVIVSWKLVAGNFSNEILVIHPRSELARDVSFVRCVKLESRKDTFRWKIEQTVMQIATVRVRKVHNHGTCITTSFGWPSQRPTQSDGKLARIRGKWAPWAYRRARALFFYASLGFQRSIRHRLTFPFDCGWRFVLGSCSCKNYPSNETPCKSEWSFVRVACTRSEWFLYSSLFIVS